MSEECIARVQKTLVQFYEDHPQIGESHGMRHVMAVHNHAVKAIESHNLCCSSSARNKISDITAMEIRIAALLHDVDDRKFFPPRGQLHNATRICQSASVQPDSINRILEMIKWVGCTENGNSIPPEIQKTNEYHLLIPRWSDRLEAVGCIGVIRCYQYNREIGAPLWKDNDLYDSPRPTSEEEVWKLATPERFEDYLNGERDKKKKRRGATANKRERSSMISHYYDKLLHVARPPKQLVRNKYLEDMAEESSKEMIEVLLRYGETGVVDEEYILSLKDRCK